MSLRKFIRIAGWWVNVDSIQMFEADVKTRKGKMLFVIEYRIGGSRLKETFRDENQWNMRLHYMHTILGCTGEETA